VTLLTTEHFIVGLLTAIRTAVLALRAAEQRTRSALCFQLCHV
jgi:hypothetical protein